MNEKDLIIGAISNLTYEQISPWLVSIKETGYQGDIALLVYDCKDLDLLKNSAIVFEVTGTFSMAMRFYEMWKAIRQYEVNNNFRYRNIITTDVRDVKFQSNPGTWLWRKTCAGAGLVVGSENIQYQNEPWSQSNMQRSFGNDVYNMIAGRQIVCAGVIAGQRKPVLDMMLSISLICNGMPNVIQGGGGPDQAALNVLLSTDAWDKITEIENVNDGGIIHLGTSMPAIEKGKGEIGFQYVNGILPKDKIKFVVPGQPKYVDGKWVSPIGTPYTIVHQYDRAE